MTNEFRSFLKKLETMLDLSRPESSRRPGVGLFTIEELAAVHGFISKALEKKRIKRIKLERGNAIVEHGENSNSERLQGPTEE